MSWAYWGPLGIGGNYGAIAWLVGGYGYGATICGLDRSLKIACGLNFKRDCCCYYCMFVEVGFTVPMPVAPDDYVCCATTGGLLSYCWLTWSQSSLILWCKASVADIAVLVVAAIVLPSDYWRYINLEISYISPSMHCYYKKRSVVSAATDTVLGGY